MQTSSWDRKVWTEKPSRTLHRPAALHEVRSPSPLDRDGQFMGLVRSFRSSGGLSRADCVAGLLASRGGQNVGTLARWMVQGEVVHFEWQHETWLPMFQFNLTTMQPSPQVGKVLSEFAGVFDPWEIAQWFAAPCASLSGRTPADAIDSDADQVLQAARCDRYLADA